MEGGDFSTKIKAILYERLANPFAGYFAVSWLVFNWRPLATFILSREDIEDRIVVVQAQLEAAGFLHSWLTPFGLAALLTVLYPWFHTGLFLLRRKAVTLHRSAKAAADGERRLSTEESRLLLAENRRLEDERHQLSVDFDGARSQLKKFRSELDKATDDAQKYLQEIEQTTQRAETAESERDYLKDQLENARDLVDDFRSPLGSVKLSPESVKALSQADNQVQEQIRKKLKEANHTYKKAADIIGRYQDSLKMALKEGEREGRPALWQGVWPPKVSEDSESDESPNEEPAE